MRKVVGPERCAIKEVLSVEISGYYFFLILSAMEVS